MGQLIHDHCGGEIDVQAANPTCDKCGQSGEAWKKTKPDGEVVAFFPNSEETREERGKNDEVKGGEG